MPNQFIPWSQEENEILINNYSEIGTKCVKLLIGRSESSVYSQARRLGLKFVYNLILSDSDREFIRKWYPIFGRGYCIMHLGKTISNIEAFTRKEGIEKIPLEQIVVSDYITDYFNVWEPHVVYILGYIWADGHLIKRKVGEKLSYTAVSLTINKKDADVIAKDLKFFDWLEWRSCWVPPKDSVMKDGHVLRANPFGYTSYFLSDRYLGKFLLENDYAVKSGASPDKILSKIPDHLKHYWWRGFFEGDGSLHVSKADNLPRIGLYSVYEQDWNFVKKLCEHLGIHYTTGLTETANGNSSRCVVRRKNDVITFCEYIFKDRETDNIGLGRKYEKFINSNLQKIELTSGKTGVCFDKEKRFNPWVVYFRAKYVGCFATEEEAIQKRIEVEQDGRIPESRKSQKNRAKKLL